MKLLLVIVWADCNRGFCFFWASPLELNIWAVQLCMDIFLSPDRSVSCLVICPMGWNWRKGGWTQQWHTGKISLAACIATAQNSTPGNVDLVLIASHHGSSLLIASRTSGVLQINFMQTWQTIAVKWRAKMAKTFSSLSLAVLFPVSSAGDNATRTWHPSHHWQLPAEILSFQDKGAHRGVASPTDVEMKKRHFVFETHTETWHWFCERKQGLCADQRMSKMSFLKQKNLEWKQTKRNPYRSK